MSPAVNDPSACPVCLGRLERDGFCLVCLLQEGLEAEHLTGSQSPVAAPAMRLLTLPCEFAGYRLLREIASGGMGIVYEAEDVKLKRVVALKVVRNAHFATREEAGRFKAEAQAIAQLDHPDIVPIYESGEEDGMPYFTMRLAEGGSLADRLKKQGVMPDREAATFMSRIARAVQFAHERGVLHRDLKPANILLDADGKPMLSDFGLAKLLDAEFQLTRSNAHVGTPHFMSPEQAAGKAKEVTTASDVWALGVMLFQMLTEKLPFTGGSAVEVMRRITQEEPEISSSVKISSQAADVPVRQIVRLHPDLATLIQRCLEKQPARRLSSAGFLADELDRFLSGKPIRSRAVGSLERMWKLALRNKAAAVAIIGISLSLIAGTMVSVHQAVKARAAERLALQQKDEAQNVSQIILASINELDEQKAGSNISPELMKAQMLKRILEFKGDPLRKAQMLAQTAIMFPHKQCLENYQQALGLLEAALGPDDVRVWDMRFCVAGQRAVIENSSDECMAELRTVLAWQFGHLGADHSSTLFTQFTLGKNLNVRKEGKEAKKLLSEVCRRVEGNASYNLRYQGQCRLEYLTAVFLAGEREVALKLCRDYTRKALEILGDRDLLTGRTLNRVASYYQKIGMLEEAVKENRHALEIFWRAVGPDNSYAQDCLAELSALLGKKGDKKGRLALVKEAVKVCDLSLGPGHPVSLYRVESCMYVQTEQKFYLDAATMGVSWLKRIRSPEGTLPIEANGVLRELARAQWARHTPERAEPVLRELISLMEQHRPDDLLRYADMSNLAEVLLTLERPAEALPLLKEAVQVFEERGQKRPQLTALALPKARKRLAAAEQALSVQKTAAQ